MGRNEINTLKCELARERADREAMEMRQQKQNEDRTGKLMIAQKQKEPTERKEKKHKSSVKNALKQQHIGNKIAKYEAIDEAQMLFRLRMSEREHDVKDSNDGSLSFE